MTPGATPGSRGRLLRLWGFFAFAGAAAAQIPIASLHGTATDGSSAALVQASISVRNLRTGATRRTTTGPDGRFQLARLEPGEYEIVAAAPGFASQRRRLVLRVGDEQTVDFQLALERLAVVVDVDAEASRLHTAELRVDGVVGREQIENLPLNGRSFLELARLEPGVGVESVANPGAFGNNYHRVSIGGSSYLQTHITVDGSSIEDRINGGTAQNFSQETVQEFQISSFNFEPAAGPTASGAVNIVTRRGGNDLHGGAFSYYRDQNLAAYPALKRDPQHPRPSFSRRQAGLSLGGPLLKDRVFWFANYENLDQNGVFAVANNHPVFSRLDVVHPSPLDFDLFNARVDGRLSDTQSGFLRASLDHNSTLAPPSTGVFMPSNWETARTRALQLQGGWTSVLGPRLVNDLRVSHQRLDNRVEAVTPQECGGGSACIGAGAPFELLVFDAPLFRVGHYLSVPKSMSPRTWEVVDSLDWQHGPHRLRVSGAWEHLSIEASHSFYEAPQITLYGPTDLLASPALRPLYDALPASLRNPNGPPPTLDDILHLPVRSVLLGIGNPQQPGPYHHESVSHPDVLRLSLQHTWALRPGLTLGSGLGYLYRTHLYNQDLPRPAYLAPLLGGDLRPPEAGVHSLDPSLGLVWAVGPRARTVLRAGAGLYHDEVDFYTPFLERGPLGPAGNGRMTVDGSVAGISFLSGPTALRGVDLVPLLPGIQSGIASHFGDGSDPSVRGIEVVKQGDRIFAPDHTTPYAVHLTAGVQRQLAGGFVLSVDAVVRHSVHLGGFTGQFGLDRNRFNRPRVTGVDPATGAVSFVRDPAIPLCTAAQARALDPKDQCSTGPIVVYESNGTALYRGLHVKLDKRPTSGLQLTASYALARNTGFVEPLRYDDPAAGYGNLAGQREHRLTVSGSWTLPAFHGASRLGRALLSGWTLAVISETDSAPPLNTLLVGLDLDGDGISRTLLPGTTANSLGQGLTVGELRELVARYNADVEARTRRVVNPDGSLTLIRPRTPFNQVINPIVLPQTFSNGDSFITQDVRLTRRIGLNRWLRLSLIVEVFNLFNVANLTGYGGVLNQLGYGQPTARVGQTFGTGGPRAFQLATRLEF
jgi:hypothetical protein